MNETKTIKVGIIGGAGYTRGGTLRLLIYPPQFDLRFRPRNSHGGHIPTGRHPPPPGHLQPPPPPLHK